MNNPENELMADNQQPESEQKPEEEQLMDSSYEPPIKRIFNHEKVTKYFKDQQPSTRNEKFIDRIFPPIIDSLHDRSNKSTGEDKINNKCTGNRLEKGIRTISKIMFISK